LQLEFEEYCARRIVNVREHVDGPRFWDKYSASPYVGCQSGCEFCYLRADSYLGRRDPDSFDTLIQVKTNAAELLRKELSPLPRDIIACGDWQQMAENRYRLSRAMLEVILDLGFPLLIVERSPLVVRDLDLLMEINRTSWVGVAFSLSSLEPTLKQAFEPHSPGLKIRLKAMQTLSCAGILAGTVLMPILPFVGDAETQIEEIVTATKEHGGSFVMAGGLTMTGIQALKTLRTVQKLDPELETRWRWLYDWKPGGTPSLDPPQSYSARLGRIVRQLCAHHGLTDRIPRHVAPGPLALNKLIAEKLYLKTYDLELEQKTKDLIQIYRRAAWTVDEWPRNIKELYDQRGQEALCELPGVGGRLAAEIEGWLCERETKQSADIGIKN